MSENNLIDLDETPDEDLIEFLLDRNSGEVDQKAVDAELDRLSKKYNGDTKKALAEIQPRIDAAVKGILDKIEYDAKGIGVVLACALELDQGDEEDEEEEDEDDDGEEDEEETDEDE